MPDKHERAPSLDRNHALRRACMLVPVIFLLHAAGVYKSTHGLKPIAALFHPLG
jgi:hypothetical protein